MPASRSRLMAALAVAATLASPLAVAADEAQRDATAARTAEVRELPPLAEIDDALISQQDLKDRLPGMIAEDYSREEAAADGRALIALGLLPEGTDYWQLSLDLLGDQVAGFWDQKTDEMFVISGDGAFGPLEEFTYAHEVVHALQDAHLGLDGLMADSLDLDADAATARAALFEGDATIASYDYLAANPSLAAAIATAPAATGAGADTLGSVPPALAISLVFPYLTGAEFVAALRAEGGWEAVDAAYADPPASTEQVMHPERYLERDDPTPVTLPDLAPALGEGWEPIDEDVLGELGIALLLADLQPGEGFNAFTGELALPNAANNAAAGWDGDTYALWANGDREVLVWSTVWDRESDAVAFSRALQAQTERRFSGRYEGEIPGDVAMIADDRAARILQTGSKVAYVLAPDLPTADAAMGALR